MITPRELTNVEIKAAVRGYDREEVNDLLERAASTIEAANERVQQLTDRLAQAQAEAGRSRETEDVLQRTLLLAQRTADETIAEATAKAQQMVEDAEAASQRLVEEAEADARRDGDAVRRRLEEETIELAARRDALLADVDAMSRFEAEYRERMVRALEADVAALRARASAAPGLRPTLSGIEVTPPAALDADETAAGDEGAPDDDGGPATSAVDVRAFFEPVSGAEHRGEPRAADGEGSGELPGTDVPSAGTEGEAPTGEIIEGEAVVVEVGEAREIDLLGGDADDFLADDLDDDAFFASLREAANDNAPLGPRRETGDPAAFEPEAERVGFRDVFRRRR